ncbi:hypothetical protein [Paramagnetospirillum caucaseum]|nr:hypothetical protein [Paramagnetospirillum caucaseum]
MLHFLFSSPYGKAVIIVSAALVLFAVVYLVNKGTNAVARKVAPGAQAQLERTSASPLYQKGLALIVAALVALGGAAYLIPSDSPNSILEDVSGVWRSRDNMLYVVSLDGPDKYVGMAGYKIPVRIESVDGDNDVINLDAAPPGGKRNLWSLMQVWDAKRESFRISLVFNNGDASNLGFVRKITPTDIPTKLIPQEPPPVQQAPTSGPVTETTVVGRYKYVEDGSNGQMSILSGRDPGLVVADIGTVSSQGQTCDITLQGKFENGRGRLQDATKQCGVELRVEPSGAASLSVADDPVGGCSASCGMNATFLGNYRKLP